MPELLHPRMADVYREKVGSLCLALESEESRTGAVEAIRALTEAILIEPDGDKLKITLKGDLAGMLSAARDSKRSSDTGRPLGPHKAGCGGAQPAEFGVLVDGSVNGLDIERRLIIRRLPPSRPDGLRDEAPHEGA
jgi:hypothetical protein